ncbi:MAG TPA: 4-hydroxyphenylpyruvate dioxygenase [Pyrinomonadaceae bacterium]|nr:4-hydroxyphenylpyruvate dioxygenase [Pyrinomonadaceae bacterium]
MSTQEDARVAPEGEVHLTGIEYLEFYVGNVHQAAHFYRTAYGFTPIAYAGLETGRRDSVSVALAQKNIRILLTGALDPQGDIARHVQLHGDGVKDIALATPDARRTFDLLVRRGARPLAEPEETSDDHGRVVTARVGTFGDTVHTLVQREGYGGPFLPGYLPARPAPAALDPHLETIDHLAICVERGSLEQWVEFYKRVFGFHQSHQEDIGTEYSAMNSRVVQDARGLVKLPMMEPAEGRRKSQIEEFLAYHRGAGVQHIAFSSQDILDSIRSLRGAGNEFLSPPASYYDMLRRRVGNIEEDIAALRDNNVLVDRDEWGYLMQIFTRPVESRPTLFLEVIQRRNARGFGGGNIKALFEAVEHEQARRGNL